MSITEWTPGELFTCRIYKRLANRPDVVWANTYELRSNGTQLSGASGAEAVIGALEDFEQLFHLPDVRFDRGVFSTLVPDGEPYNPASFVTRTLSSSGARGTDQSQPAALNVCLKVRRIVETGREGRALYRRVLQEGDIAAPAGVYTLDGGAAGALDSIIADTYTEGLSVSLSAIGVDMVMVGKPGFNGVPNVRAVQGLSASGVTVKPFNNRYFDRQ